VDISCFKYEQSIFQKRGRKINVNVFIEKAGK
jgi:hypothetical protein